jgi:branched-chain amino acid transport system ATP-binding protein
VSPALKVTGLAAGYSGFRILGGFDLDLVAGRITAIVGSNGAGKSTLLRALAGLLPREGKVTLDGHVLPAGSAMAAVRAGVILVAEG